MGYSEIVRFVDSRIPSLLCSIHMQYSSTGNPDIIPGKEKKEIARDHTERLQCELRDRKTNRPHITLSGVLLTILF